MKKLISTAILLLIGYIFSYLLGIGEHHKKSDCKPYKQENAFIKIDLADNDDDGDDHEFIQNKQHHDTGRVRSETKIARQNS